MHDTFLHPLSYDLAVLRESPRQYHEYRRPLCDWRESQQVVVVVHVYSQCTHTLLSLSTCLTDLSPCPWYSQYWRWRSRTPVMTSSPARVCPSLSRGSSIWWASESPGPKRSCLDVMRWGIAAENLSPLLLSRWQPASSWWSSAWSTTRSRRTSRWRSAGPSSPTGRAWRWSSVSTPWCGSRWWWPTSGSSDTRGDRRPVTSPPGWCSHTPPAGSYSVMPGRS